MLIVFSIQNTLKLCVYVDVCSYKGVRVNDDQIIISYQISLICVCIKCSHTESIFTLDSGGSTEKSQVWRPRKG